MFSIQRETFSENRGSGDRRKLRGRKIGGGAWRAKSVRGGDRDVIPNGGYYAVVEKREGGLRSIFDQKQTSCQAFSSGSPMKVQMITKVPSARTRRGRGDLLRKPRGGPERVLAIKEYNKRFPGKGEGELRRIATSWAQKWTGGGDSRSKKKGNRETDKEALMIRGECYKD